MLCHLLTDKCSCRFCTFHNLVISLSYTYLICALYYFRLEVIDKCFSHETVEEIVDALVSDGSSFYFEILRNVSLLDSS